MRNKLVTEVCARLDSWFEKASGYQGFGCIPEEGLFIYGAGDLGSLALKYCESCDLSVAGVVDTVKEGLLETGIAHYSVQRPESICAGSRRNSPILIAVSTSSVETIASYLRTIGWKRIMPFYALTSIARAGHPLQNGWLIGETTTTERGIAKDLCEVWGDETSVRHYEAFIAWHSDYSEVDLRHCKIEPNSRYAISDVVRKFQYRRPKVFVDVGSHLGESVIRLNKAGLRFENYILIEPDPSSRSMLEASCPQIIPLESRYSIHGDVMSSDQGSTPFRGGLGYCSQVVTQGLELRKTQCLDAYDLEPDYIKVHTEGQEARVLRAKESIFSYRPVITFSVYHQRTGFYKDILDTINLFSGYRWLFRLHSYQGTGAFVYGIPAQKLFNNLN